MTNTRRWIPVVLIVAGLCAYANSLSGAFIFDDVESILKNPTIRQLWPIWVPLSPPVPRMQGRPFPNLTLAINYALGGYQVWGYHALNLAIHILAGLTLLGVVRRTLLQPVLRERFGAAASVLALAVAVIWTVHPLPTEAVTYVNQRSESLMGLFYLLTLYCFIRGAESPSRGNWYALSVVACGLGMGSKEVMVSAPLMVLFYDRTFIAGSFREAWRRRWSLYLALAATWIVLGWQMVSVAKGGGYHLDLSRGRYVLTQLYAIMHYLQLSVWPHPLVFDYGTYLVSDLREVVPQALLIALLLAGTLVSLWRWPAIGFLGVWFFAILAPTSSVIPQAMQTMAERRMYLPLAAVVSFAVVGLYSLAGRRILAAFALAAIGFGFLTMRRNEDYRSDFTIWADTVAKRPENARAHNDFGLALTGQGRLHEAIGHYREALRISPNMADAHGNLGAALAQQGDLDEAVEHLLVDARLRPTMADPHYNLGMAYARQGKFPAAIEELSHALRLDPTHARARYNLGLVLIKQSKTEEAIVHLNEAARLRPDMAEIQWNLGLAHGELGHFDQAVVHLTQAVRLNPSDPNAHYDLGVTLVRLGRLDDALAEVETAVRLNPRFEQAQQAARDLRQELSKSRTP